MRRLLGGLIRLSIMLGLFSIFVGTVMGLFFLVIKYGWYGGVPLIMLVVLALSWESGPKSKDEPII